MNHWQNLPCEPDDLNTLNKLMPGGFIVVEWDREEDRFKFDTVFGLNAPLVDEIYLHDMQPTTEHAVSEERLSVWPDGRTCFAAWSPEAHELSLFTVNGKLAYADQDAP